MNKPVFVSEENIITTSSLKEKPGYHYVHGTGKIELKIPIEDSKLSDSETLEDARKVRFAQNTTTSSLFTSKETTKKEMSTPKVLPQPPPQNNNSPQQSKEANQPNPMEQGESMISQSKSKPPNYNERNDIPAHTDAEGLVPESLMFRDGKRHIDLVLVFEEAGVMTLMEAKKKEFRRTFQQNLIKQGLELELEHKSLSYNGKTWFLKIHIPLNTLKRVADAISMTLPVKRLISISAKSKVEKDQEKIEKRQVKRELHQGKREEREALRRFHQEYRGDRKAKQGEEHVNIDEKQTQTKYEKEKAKLDEKEAKRQAKEAKRDEKEAKRDEKEAKHEEEEAKRDEMKTKVIEAKRAAKQAKLDEETMREQKEQTTHDEHTWFEKFHMKWSTRWRRLLENEFSFYAAHHDGVRRVEQFLVKERFTEFSPAQRSYMAMQILLRAQYDNTKLLYIEWARASNWYKAQPLWLISQYFGSKIGMYFCWLGFYTWMLLFPAVIGTLCFIYGLLTMDSSPNAVPSNEICDVTGPGNITLCPLCDHACRYQKLSESCVFSKLSYVFDNPATVFFAVFMSFWATSFLELWKRRAIVLRWEWDLFGVEEYEEARAEFEESVKTYIINPITRVREPHMTTWAKSLRYVATSSAVLFMIAIVLGAVLGTIIYRISMVLVIYRAKGTSDLIKKNARILNAMAAAVLNLVVIFILSKLYRKIAVHLVNMENPRTQTEFNDSYAFKIFIFECVNYYSSLVYIAFFKGLFYDHPGDCEARKSEFLMLKGDICDPAGCLSELCIHLAIIMIGKQFALNFIDFVIPWFHNLYRQTAHRYVTLDQSKPLMTWERDYALPSPKRLIMFNDTLKLIIQYGFVTLFVAAFPLAPLFALINNIIEIRLEAFRLLTTARRPLAERVDDLGAWYNILKGITYCAVIFNAFVIGYTSDFIPCMVYKYVYSPDFTLAGYINHSLSWFNTSDYREEWGADTEVDPPLCAYSGSRNPPDHHQPYARSMTYWHEFTARLAFVVIFEHLIFGLTGLMRVIIPDVPRTLTLQLQREAMIFKEEKFDDQGRIKELKKLITDKITQPKKHRSRRRNPAPEVVGDDRPFHGLNTVTYD